jgi:hypothetical protein
MPTLDFKLPIGSVKFREVDPDKVVFNLPQHTVTKPRTITIGRSLPQIRRGNNGTLKSSFNIHTSYEIPTEGGGMRTVPVVLKLESSVPVGLYPNDALASIGVLRDIMSRNNDMELLHLFQNGNLPSDQAGEFFDEGTGNS